jgi:vacuolar-type H+-ATPase subunit H
MGHYGVVPYNASIGSVQQMEQKEILEKIKSTEAEIRKNIDAAQHKRNEMLTQAQKQAQKLEEEEEQRMRTERDALLAAAKKEREKKRQTVIKKAYDDAEKIKKNAEVKKAKELFLEEFMEFLNV